MSRSATRLVMVSNNFTYANYRLFTFRCPQKFSYIQHNVLLDYFATTLVGTYSTETPCEYYINAYICIMVLCSHRTYTFTEGGSTKTKPLCMMITAYSSLWNHILMIILNALYKRTQNWCSYTCSSYTVSTKNVITIARSRQAVADHGQGK